MTEKLFNDLALFIGIYGIICLGVFVFAIWQIRRKWFRDENGNFREGGTDGTKPI